MIKYISLILVLIFSFSFARPALASVCRNYNGHEICILDISRSAKKYWEYKAAVSVDGVKRPIEIYNCRSKVKIQQDRTVVPFRSDDSGKLICSYFKPRTSFVPRSLSDEE